MKTYPKIKTLWKRTAERPCNMIIGEYSEPEFEYLANGDWEATEKLDGTNVRIMWDGDKVRSGGKTDAAQMPIVLIDRLNELFAGEANEQLFEQTFNGPICLYGEGVGPKIQKGGGNYGRVDFVLFDVKVGENWLMRSDVEDVARKLNIKVAPVVLCGDLLKLSSFVSAGFKSEFGDFIAEGVVATPMVPLSKRDGQRIITKLKHKDFLKLQS